jgi:CheY-like chemotaxis protein
MDSAKILLVEDHRLWREQLEEILERAGYKVETAVGYGEAFGKLRRGSFNLVITDLRLGPEKPPRDFEGMTLLQDAQERGIPTIVVTGYPNVELARRAFEDCDVVQFLEKHTFEVKRFRDIVGQVLPPALKMEYRDFDLWVEAPTTEGYPLRANSTQGQARGHMKLDPSSIFVQSDLKRLAARETDETFLVEFGTFLYNALFVSDIESLFLISLGTVMEQDGLGLRLRLRIDPPELSALPWEYLYSPSQRHFLGASKKTPLSRFLEVFRPARSLATTLPLKILVVIPAGSELDTQKEKEILTKALGKLGDAVRPTVLEGNVTRSAVADALLENKHHVFHFIGHGVFEDDQGYLIFNDEHGGRDRLSDDIFARFFLNEPSMKLVVLNACEGATVSSCKPMVGMAPKLVECGIPAVIAHQYSMEDRTAICFAREFYRSLCMGTQVGHVDVAMAHARNQLSIRFPDERCLGTSVLFMRAADGLIFDLTS